MYSTVWEILAMTINAQLRFSNDLDFESEFFYLFQAPDLKTALIRSITAMERQLSNLMDDEDRARREVPRESFLMGNPDERS